ncbi:MAG: TspO/MBR family protein [Candidatus Nanoarchaeia archaeon]
MKYLWLALSVILCLGIGFVSGQLTDTGSDWFLNLTKPSFYPPGYLFGVVWTILYIMMGVSLYLIIEKTKDKLPYILFGSQLVLNFFWTLIFFGMKNILFAIVEIILLWILLLLTIISFRKYSKPAAYLLIPYILWVTFAAILTVSIYLLN